MGHLKEMSFGVQHFLDPFGPTCMWELESNECAQSCLVFDTSLQMAVAELTRVVQHLVHANAAWRRPCNHFKEACEHLIELVGLSQTKGAAMEICFDRNIDRQLNLQIQAVKPYFSAL